MNSQDKNNQIMSKKNNNNSGEIIIYEGADGAPGIEVQIKDENVWLSQKHMAELFDFSVDNVSLHMKNIFKDGELNENSVTEEYSVTAYDGKNYLVRYYNLDAIISVGYRINSLRGTQFRIWATARLHEYKKYQTKTLSPVEKAYLENIKALEKKVKNNKSKK